ncbi:MAG: DUF4434 domain-containing protein [Clostridia bacterium]|nr:DUF4434 domain-containing protein [Clostridia bacterium]
MKKLNENTRYCYSYPSLKIAKNDPCGDKLTSGKNWIKAEIKNERINSGTWYGTTVLDLFDSYKEPHFYIQNDFGIIDEVSKVSIKFSKEGTLPERVEIFFTNDGYNYTVFETPKENVLENGNELTYEFCYDTPLKAKGVRVMIFGETDKEIIFADLCVFGEKNENEIKLLSKGLSYTWKGEKVEGFEKCLTDGNYSGFEGRKATENHPVSTSSVSIIDTDLGKESNVFEVVINTVSNEKFKELPRYITVEYSLDGKEYSDFGQGYQQGEFGTEDDFSARYIVTRNHTVKARFIRIYITGAAALSQFSVFGTDNEVSEMKYNHFNRKELLAHTNVMEGKEVFLNGEGTYKLTDNIFTYGEEDLEDQKENEIICDLGEIKDEINCAMVNSIKKNGFVHPDKIEVYLSSDGENYELVEGETISHDTGRSRLTKIYFENKKARFIKFFIAGEKRMSLYEVAAYEKQPPLPLYRGGFFQLHTLTENTEHRVIKNSEYMWYIQLKGMKDMGMDYVILQHGAKLKGKVTPIDSPRLFKKGYTKAVGYGTKDPYETVLKIAEKLGMKVYLGTWIPGASQYWALMDIGGMKHLEENIEDALDYLMDTYEKYKDYKTFEGYYYSYETCDEWLNAKYGVEIFRKVYGDQTKLLRKIDPKRPIMASPAIWRSGSPEEGERRLYELIKPFEGETRPIIDIIAAQDCLGREETLYITNAAYADAEEHMEAWAKGVRKAGAQFWNDAEVFEITYQTKRYKDNVHTMELSSKLTNGIIVFDYPHHFCEISKGIINSHPAFNTVYVVSRYIKRYNTLYREKDRIGME